MELYKLVWLSNVLKDVLGGVSISDADVGHDNNVPVHSNGNCTIFSQ